MAREYEVVETCIPKKHSHIRMPSKKQTSLNRADKKLIRITNVTFLVVTKHTPFSSFTGCGIDIYIASAWGTSEEQSSRNDL